MTLPLLRVFLPTSIPVDDGTLPVLFYPWRTSLWWLVCWSLSSYHMGSLFSSSCVTYVLYLNKSFWTMLAHAPVATEGAGGRPARPRCTLRPGGGLAAACIVTCWRSKSCGRGWAGHPESTTGRGTLGTWVLTSTQERDTPSPGQTHAPRSENSAANRGRVSGMNDSTCRRTMGFLRIHWVRHLFLNRNVDITD